MYHIDIYDQNKHCSRGEYGIKLIIDIGLSVVKTHKHKEVKSVKTIINAFEINKKFNLSIRRN